MFPHIFKVKIMVQALWKVQKLYLQQTFKVGKVEISISERNVSNHVKEEERLLGSLY